MTTTKRGRPQAPGLRWHRGKGRWYRLYDGKPKYFGPQGTKGGDPDLSVLPAADAAWHRHEASLMTDYLQRQSTQEWAEIDRRIAGLSPARRQELETASPSEYIRLSDQYLSDNPPPDNDPVTTVNVCDLYVSYLRDEADGNPRKQAHYVDARNRLRQFTGQSQKATSKPWTFEGADLPIGALTREHFRKYRDRLNRYVRDGKFAQPTVNKIFRLVRDAFAFARREKGIEQGYSTAALPEFLELLKTKSADKVDRATFTPDDLATMLKTFDAKWTAITLISLNAALNNTDAATMKWGCIDWETGQYDNARQKTGKTRRTPLWSRTLDSLRKWKDETPFGTGDDDLVFPNESGQCYIVVTGKTRNDGLSRRYTKQLQDAGLTEHNGMPLTFATLRKSAGTHALSDDADETAIEMLLGHATGKVWKKHYHQTAGGKNEKVKTATDALEAHYFGKMRKGKK